MIPEIGHFALVLALFIALIQTIVPIVGAYKGKLCANVDLDRQGFAFMTQAEIREQIKQVVDRMALPEGGLMIAASVWDTNTPLENIEAILLALEDYCFP